jgi:hypothetical protein
VSIEFCLSVLALMLLGYAHTWRRRCVWPFVIVSE